MLKERKDTQALSPCNKCFSVVKLKGPEWADDSNPCLIKRKMNEPLESEYVFCVNKQVMKLCCYAKEHSVLVRRWIVQRYCHLYLAHLHNIFHL